MRLYEYEGKQLFKEFGIPVPQSVLIGDRKELDKITYPAVLKAQVFIGKRGKVGAIKIVNSRQEAELGIKDLLGRVIDGYEVKSILIEEKINI